MIMNSTKIYERFHKKTKTQHKLINEKNFTYRHTLEVLNKYVDKNSIAKITVLDIGCGAGTVSFYLANKGAKVLGVDISRGAINKCRETAQILNLKSKTKFINGSITKVSKKYKFNLVICSEVIEHISNDRAFLLKIHQKLKKGGILILSTPSSNAPLYKIGFATKFDKKVGHLRRYSRAEIAKLIKSTGFSIIELRLTEGI